jgi:hypothetical protein
MTVFQV